VIEKRLVLVEELWLTKRKVTRNEIQTVRLQKEEVTVERTNETEFGNPNFENR